MQVYVDSDSDESAAVVPILSTYFSQSMGTCAICLNALKPGYMIELCCKHYFHTKCLNKWFEISTTCPVCRSQY